MVLAWVLHQEEQVGVNTRWTLHSCYLSTLKFSWYLIGAGWPQDEILIPALLSSPDTSSGIISWYRFCYLMIPAPVPSIDTSSHLISWHQLLSSLDTISGIPWYQWHHHLKPILYYPLIPILYHLRPVLVSPANCLWSYSLAVEMRNRRLRSKNRTQLCATDKPDFTSWLLTSQQCTCWFLTPARDVLTPATPTDADQ